MSTPPEAAAPNHTTGKTYCQRQALTTHAASPAKKSAAVIQSRFGEAFEVVPAVAVTCPVEHQPVALEVVGQVAFKSGWVRAVIGLKTETISGRPL